MKPEMKRSYLQELKQCKKCKRIYNFMPDEAGSCSYGYFFMCKCETTLFWRLDPPAAPRNKAA